MPHGLKSGGKGVTPTLIVCDRSSPIAVTGYDTLVVTFTNVSDVMASANFRVEHDHSIHAIGTPTVAWQGWDGTAIPSGPAGGDLDQTYPNPRVVQIQGIPVQNGVGPANGDSLLYNSALNQWQHAPITFGGGPPVGPASGDLGGIYPNPQVVGLQTTPVSATAPNIYELLAYDGAAWTPTDISALIPVAVDIYGVFSDSTDQSIPTKPNVLAVKYNTVEMSNGVTVTNNLLGQPTRLTVSVEGIYSFDISPQLLHPGGTGTTIYFWAKLNGVNVPRSASSLDMGNNNNRVLPFLQLEMAMAAGDYLEWFFTQSGSGTNLEHLPAEPLPPAVEIIPEIPSVIVNVKRFSAIP